MKRLLSLVLLLALTLGLAAPALAVDTQTAQTSAQLLYELNLFRGAGTNPDGSVDFQLDRAPTRAESVTMLVRLLGAEEAALAKTRTTPFTDVPDWAAPYVGYAYEKGLAKGVSDTQFDPSAAVTTAQYLTFLLRALGYRDGTDFTWDAPWKKTDALGITNGDYNEKTEFLRGDAAWLSEQALYASPKGSDVTLLETLLEDGVIRDSGVVIWDSGPLVFETNFASFLFFPVAGSPATFEYFKLDRVTVNGLRCETLQVNTPADVSAYMASISQNVGGFGYVEVSYDQAAALNAADKTYTDANGNTYPLLGFTFSYTGTRPDGETVSGVFTSYYYLDTQD